MPVIEAITLELEKSCQNEKAACAVHTMTRTMASARFAKAGGRPSGLHAMNTRIAAIKRIAPKPPKRYPIVLRNHWEGGGDGEFGPTLFSFCEACVFARPAGRGLLKRVKSSSMEAV